MVINGRSTAQVRLYNSFKLAVGSLLFVIALLAAISEGRFVVSAQSKAILQSATAHSDQQASSALIKPTVITNAPLQVPTFNTETRGTVEAGQYVLISGTAAPGSLVKLVASNELIGEAKTGQDGIWQIDVLFDIVGTFLFTIESILEDGRSIDSSTMLEVRSIPQRDPALKTPIFDPPIRFEYAAGEVVSISGTGTPLAMLAVVMNGIVFDVVQIDIDGRWQYRAQFPEIGEYEIHLQLVDPDLEESIVSDSHMLMIVEADENSAEPRPTIVATNILTPTMQSSTNSGHFRGGTVSIEGRANPNLALEIIINRTVHTWLKPDDDGSWEHTVAIEAPNSYSLYVRSVEADGRVISYSDDVLVLLIPGPPGTADSEPCAGYFTPGEFLPRNQYRVAQCETFSSIADRIDSTAEALISLNSELENPRAISPEQIINLPPMP